MESASLPALRVNQIGSEGLDRLDDAEAVLAVTAVLSPRYLGVAPA